MGHSVLYAVEPVPAATGCCCTVVVVVADAVVSSDIAVDVDIDVVG